jgi:hypothetical protein
MEEGGMGMAKFGYVKGGVPWSTVGSKFDGQATLACEENVSVTE